VSAESCLRRYKGGQFDGMAVIAEIDHEACDELVAELRPLLYEQRIAVSAPASIAMSARAVSSSTVTAARVALIALSVSRTVGKRTSSKRGLIS
jgi:hypothetical protein